MNRKLHSLAAIVAVTIGCSTPASAEPHYPEKPIRAIVGFSAGGPTDIVARLVAKGLSEQLGVAVVVENKPGAGGNIGAAEAKAAEPDGYTIFFTGANHTINAGMYPNLPYDPVKDFAAVSIIAEAPSVLVVRPDFPVDDAKQFFEKIKKDAGKYSIATAGGGQLQARQFMNITSTSLVDVPYKGAAPAVTDLAGGHVDMSLATLGSVLPQIEAKQIKAIAVAAAQRSELLPDIKTFDEQGYSNIHMGSWYGLLVPRHTSEQIIEELAGAVDNVIASDHFKESLAAAGLVPVRDVSRADLSRRIERESREYLQVGRELRSSEKK